MKTESMMKVAALFGTSVAAGFTAASIQNGFTGNVAIVTGAVAVGAVATIAVAASKQIKLMRLERDASIRRWFARLRRADDVRRAGEQFSELSRVAELAERRKHFQIYTVEKPSKVVDFRYRVAAKDCEPIKGHDIIVYHVQ